MSAGLGPYDIARTHCQGREGQGARWEGPQKSPVPPRDGLLALNLPQAWLLLFANAGSFCGFWSEVRLEEQGAARHNREGRVKEALLAALT